MHDPLGYFPRRFLNDFETFWRALERHGSASPGRVQGEDSFSAEDFAVRENGTDLMDDIHKARRMPFMYGMMFSILMDQLLYTHFRAQYGGWNVSMFFQGPRFGLGAHPKMHFEEKDAPYHVMERPWLIFSPENLKTRDWKPSDVVTGFRPYADAMVGLWGRAVDRGALPGLDWGMVVHALSQDPHVVLSAMGRAVIESASSRHWTKISAA